MQRSHYVLTNCRRISGAGLLTSRFLQIIACAALIWPLFTAPIRAQDDTAAVHENTDTDLTAKLVHTAMLIQAREQEVLDGETRLDELKLRRRSMLARFDRQRGDLSQLLAALQRLSRQPPALLLFRTEAAADYVQGATLLGAVVKNVEQEAAVLREDLAEIDQLEQVMTGQRRDLMALLENLQGEQARLSGLLEQQNSRQRALIETAAANSGALRAMAEKAKDAGDLLVSLEKPPHPAPPAKPEAKAQATPQEATPAPAAETETALLAPPPPVAGAPVIPISAAKGRLSLPARGKIIANFGARDSSGATRRGLSIRTRESAEVVAPFGGKIVFAGPFRAYGQLLIVEAGEGYHILLSGMSQVHGVVGQSVAQGQPIGRMGTGPEGDGTSDPGQSSDLRDLYVEFRKDGKPFNPMPWLDSNAKKVSG